MLQIRKQDEKHTIELYRCKNQAKMIWGVEQLFLENEIADGKRSNSTYINLIKWNKSLKEMKK